MNRIHESYLSIFFDEMNHKFPNLWCVLHSYDTLPYYSESDVDMAFGGKDIKALEHTIKSVADRQGWTLYQKLWYDVPNCYYYVLKENNTETFLALDFLVDNDGIGAYGFNTNTLTNNCVNSSNNFPIPNPEIAFCYRLTKRIVKGEFQKSDKPYLIEHYNLSKPDKIENLLIQLYGLKGAGIVKNFLVSPENTLSKTDIRFLYEIRNKKTSSILNKIKFHFWNIRRSLNRCWYPCGIIVLLPDLPKEDVLSIKNALQKKLNILFRFTELSNKKKLKHNIISFVGSTLVLIPRSKINNKRVVKYDWLFPNYMEISNMESQINNIDELVANYYRAILKALKFRINEKRT